jgi:RNA 2',3'-cyclic 3'-phosphodiesterase
LSKRLFIAVDVDEKTRAQVADISAEVRDALGSVAASWVRPDRLHLTLYFCGNADAAVEQRVLEALARPFAEAPFNLMFSGVGFFPGRGSPRVVWLGIGEGQDTLRRLQALLAVRINGHGAPRGATETFSPHLTLARLRAPVPRAEVAHLGHIPSSAGPARIDRVTLYESRLSPRGPTYVPLAAALLQPWM